MKPFVVSERMLLVAKNNFEESRNSRNARKMLETDKMRISGQVGQFFWDSPITLFDVVRQK